MSPNIGERFVSPTRQVRIEFNGEINPASVTQQNVGLAINEVPIPSNIKVLPSGRVITLDVDDGFAPGAVIQAFILEDTLQDMNGNLVDVDSDGDGLYDLMEWILGLNPDDENTDGDVTNDFFFIYPELQF